MSGITLDKFIKEQKESIEKFRSWWIKMNGKDPDGFPIEMPEDNVGLWYEQFEDFTNLIERC